MLPGDCTLALCTLLISFPVFFLFFNHAITINQWFNAAHQPGICVCLFHHIQLLYYRVQCKLGPPLVPRSLLPWRQEDFLALNGHVYPKIPLEWVLLSLVCYSVLLRFPLWHIQWGTFGVTCKTWQSTNSQISVMPTCPTKYYFHITLHVIAELDSKGQLLDE